MKMIFAKICVVYGTNDNYDNDVVGNHVDSYTLTII